MKSDLSGAVVVGGNVDQSNAIECTFDASGTAHLMNILSNLYSNAPLAVLREYATNAYDSHIEAGQTRPIEILLPTSLRPTLDVRDFGVGLSRDEIINVYSRYGASTKRDTNTQLGTFGVGSKAAFTMGSQFVVTGVKDGRKTVALFALNDEGIGTVNILSDEETPEPNGVLVSVGVSKIQEIRTAAHQFFSTWQPGTVLVDDKEPDSIWNQAEKVTKDIYAYKIGQTYTRAEPLAVMGGVGYKISQDILQRIKQEEKDLSIIKTISKISSNTGENFIFKVPIGSVNITPSREDLRDTPLTLKTISAMIGDATREVISSLQKQVETEPDYYAAAKKALALNSVQQRLVGLDLSSFTWRGKTIPDHVNLSDMAHVRRDYRSWNQEKLTTDRYVSVYLKNYDPKDQIIISGYDGFNERSIKYKMMQYMTHHNIHNIYLVPEKGSTEWFYYDGTHGTKLYTAEEWREEIKKLPKGLSAGATKTQYPVWMDGNLHNLTIKEVLSKNIPVRYLDMGGASKFRNEFYADAAKGKAVVMTNYRKKLEVFLKHTPLATDFNIDLKEATKKAFDAVTKQELEEYTLSQQHIDTSMYTLLNKLPKQQIKSKTVLEFMGKVEAKKKPLNPALMQKMNDLIGAGFVVPTAKLDYEEPKWAEKFPLLFITNNDSYSLNYGVLSKNKPTVYDHLVNYLNCVGI